MLLGRVTNKEIENRDPERVGVVVVEDSTWTGSWKDLGSPPRLAKRRLAC